MLDCQLNLAGVQQYQTTKALKLVVSTLSTEQKQSLVSKRSYVGLDPRSKLSTDTLLQRLQKQQQLTRPSCTKAADSRRKVVFVLPIMDTLMLKTNA